MNLEYPGLRAYWPMSSVDENIDVYDISGHGRTLSCVYVESPSVSPSAPPSQAPMLRNSFSSYRLPIITTNYGVISSLEYTSPKDASGIVGTVTNIHTNDGSYDGQTITPGSIVRNDDYIYIYDRYTVDPDIGPWEERIMEYKISNGTKSYITVSTSAPSPWWIADGWSNLSLIEGRKLFFFHPAEGMWDDPTYYYFYIVDFGANTCTETLTIPWEDGDYEREAMCTAVIKDDYGDIHLLVSCKYSEGTAISDKGWSIWEKNYTDNTPWVEHASTYPYNTTTNGYVEIYPYIISNNRYFCVPIWYYCTSPNLSPYPTSYLWIIYDITTGGTAIINGTVSFFPTWTHHANVSSMEDATNHKIYVEWNTGSPVHSWSIYELNPSAGTFNETPIVAGENFMSASNTYLYDWESGGDVHRTSDQALQDNSARPANADYQSMLMDDSNDSIWYMNGATLKRYNFVTDTIDKSFATGIIATNIGITHIGDAFVLTASSDKSIIDYYLVT